MTNKAVTDQTDQQQNTALNEAIDELHVPRPGDNIEGTVLEATKHSVYLDLGPLGIGVIRGRELWEALDSYTNLKPEDVVIATLLEMENENGNIELSFRQASREQAWTDLQEKLESAEVFEVTVKEANRGGLLTRINGIQAFLPVSQLSSEHYPRVEGGDQSKIFEKLKSFVGDKINVQVITTEQKEEKLIVSEKKAEFEKQKEKIGDLKVGDTVKGEISGVVDFGAFIKFSGLEGLIHISELAWQRIDNPADIVKVGEKIEAKVIGIDDTKITLSLKQLRNDPWSNIEKKYKIGQLVDGVVIKTTPYGAFVQLDDDIHGLVHISEISSKKVENVADFLSNGDKKTFKILSIEPKDHRLGLSLKVLAEKKDKETEDDSEKDKKDSEGDKPKAKKSKEKEEKEEKKTT
ncbi:S1 RNA-binding domain-containing protein [Patescibacteria group bacterium]|nr:S1 RNA-binding domain-containing protein [Patescibacteria group bacterium]